MRQTQATCAKINAELLLSRIDAVEKTTKYTKYTKTNVRISRPAVNRNSGGVIPVQHLHWVAFPFVYFVYFVVLFNCYGLEPVLKLRGVLRRGILAAAKAARPEHPRSGL